MLLLEYDIEYRSQKAIKGSVLADHLAHQPIEDYQSVQYDFPDEEILYLKMKDCDEPLLEEGPEPGSRWGMLFDGAVNQYGNGIGVVIITPQGTHFPFRARLTFKCTNNMVEYEACIMGVTPQNLPSSFMHSFLGHLTFHIAFHHVNRNQIQEA